MKVKIGVSVLLVSLASVLFGAGAVHTWCEGSSAGNWANAANWAEQTAIEDGDIVVVPAGCTAQIVDADIETVNKLAAIKTPALDSVVEFTIDGDDVMEVLPSINRDGYCSTSGQPPGTYLADRSNGQIVKKGSGTLWLKNRDGLYSYLTASIRIDEGSLRLPQVPYGYRNMNFGRITIARDAMLLTTTWNEQAGDSARTTCMWCMLEGEGTVKNPSKYRVDFFPMSSETAQRAVFRGHFEGDIYSWTDGKSRFQDFLGTGSDTNPEGFVVQANSVYGFAELGGKKPDGTIVGGSFGYGGVRIDHNGTLVYKGEGGENWGLVADYSQNLVRATIDGGETGGLRMCGTISFTCNTLTRLRLTGDHVLPCTVEGAIVNNADGAMYIAKEGTGTWALLGTRSHEGAFAVRNGTLQFDSIANAGVDCALGRSSLARLYEDYAGAMADATPVPYAFLLGAAGTKGTMEYIGETAASSDRVFALAGDGEIRSVEAPLMLLGGVSSLDEGTHVLAVGGAADVKLANVSDGAGRVKIVKEGTGTLTLVGSQSFSGGLAVLGGAATIGTKGGYRYYRFVLKNKIGIARYNSGSGNVWFNFGRIGLFNAAGEAQDKNLTFNTDARNKPTLLRPGEFTFEIPLPCSAANGKDLSDPGKLAARAGSDLAYLFDDSLEHASEYATIVHGNNNDTTSWWPYKKDEVSRLVTVTLHLPENADPVTSYDIGLPKGGNLSSGVNLANFIGEWHVEASEDGLAWDTVSSVSAGESFPTDRSSFSDTTWLKGNTSYATEAGWTHTTGWQIPSAPAEGRRFVDGLSSVEVAGGATLSAGDAGLSVTSLALDLDAVDKTGTFDGFMFAERGTVIVTGAAAKPKQMLFPLVFRNAAGTENIKNWTITYNGVALPKWRVSLTTEGVTLMPPGITISFR